MTEGIKYIGSKKKLIPYILDVISELDSKVVLDGFAGTTRVGQALRNLGCKVVSNDIAYYSFVFGKCYLETTKRFDLGSINRILYELNRVQGEEGFLTEKYGGGSRSEKKGQSIDNPVMFWKKENVKKADAILGEIEKYRGDHAYYILITSLILALDKVDNTVGVQQAFLKHSWSKRSEDPLFLRMPNIPYDKLKGKVYREDINKIINKIEVDLAYYDPPYTTHNYSSYYHIWDTMVLNDKPEVAGVNNRRKVVEKSKYNSKKTALESLSKLLNNTKSKHILLSYNNEGIIDYEDIILAAKNRGSVCVKEIDYKRNVMSQIGIYDNLGKKVGIPGHKENKEYLILIECRG